MPRILLDQNAPLGLRKHLSDHEVITARYMGWEALANGDLIAAAEDYRFDILITADQNLQYQQNMTARRITIVGTRDKPVGDDKPRPRARRRRRKSLHAGELYRGRVRPPSRGPKLNP